MCWRQVSFAVGEMQALSYPIQEKIGGRAVGPLLGGGAYLLHQWLMAPYHQPVTLEELHFNQWLLAVWATVEQTFRQSKGQW